MILAPMGGGTKVDKPSGKIAKSLKEVCDNPNVKYDTLAANLKVKMLEIDNEANKWNFFYDQDSQDFKIAIMATTTHYKLQNISISQVDFDNVYLEAKEPTCEARTNSRKEELLNDKHVDDKKAAEYEKIVVIKDIIKIKRI